MKKFISFLIALTLILQVGILSIPVSAASSSVANLEVSTENVFAGDAVYVTVSLTSNPGLTYVKLKVSYDTNALTLFGVQNGEIINDLTRGSSYVWSATDTTTATGTFATLIFSVSEDASAGTYPVTITCVEAYNNESDVSVNIQNGSVVVNAEECVHDMESISYKAPTCENAGSRVLKCTKCDYSETVAFDIVDCVAENEAYCINDAECKYCGDVLESAYGHKYRTQVIDPTSTDEGYTLYTCMRCGDSYQDNILPPVDDSIPVTGVTLNKTSETLKIGDILSLTATVTPSNATNKNVTWSSSNSSIASVVNGVVTANRAGTATIKATTVDGGFIAECIIKVDNNPPVQNEVSVTTKVLYFSSTMRAKPTLIVSNNSNYTITNLTFSVKEKTPTGDLEYGNLISQEPCSALSSGESYEWYFMSDRLENDPIVFYVTVSYTINSIRQTEYMLVVISPKVNGAINDFHTYDILTDSNTYSHTLSCSSHSDCDTGISEPHWCPSESDEKCVICNTAVTTKPEISATLTLDSVTAIPGETVKINLNLSQNPGLASLVLKVSYDQNLLTLTKVEYNTSMGGQTVPPASFGTPVTLYWVNGFGDYTENGLFATLTFKVADSAAEGDKTTISVTYNPDDVFNIKDENIGLIITSGNVTVINYIPGDINGDGTLNNKDVTRFMQYNAGWDVEVNTVALDVNGDGSVNNKDVTRLMQYNAGWDVEIY